jgi:hypothetical protein
MALVLFTKEPYPAWATVLPRPIHDGLRSDGCGMTLAILPKVLLYVMFGEQVEKTTTFVLVVKG